MLDQGCQKFISLFTGSCDGPFKYDHTHIADLEFRSVPDIVLPQQSKERIYTPTFLHLLNFYQQQNT